MRRGARARDRCGVNEVAGIVKGIMFVVGSVLMCLGKLIKSDESVWMA